MRILITSDLHAQKSNIDIIEQLLNQLIQIKADRTILLGDLFHLKGHLRTECLNLYVKYFSQWNNKLYLLPGNHDLISCKLNENALQVFSLLPNIKILDFNYTEPGFSYLPYTEDIDFIETFINNQQTNNILFTHIDIANFAHSNYYISASKIHGDLFKKFKYVFSGHLHKPQQLNNIIYVGSPFTTDFGEAEEDKRIIIYDDVDNSFENIYLDLPKHKIFEYNINKLEDIEITKYDLLNKIKPNYIIRLILNVEENISKKINLSMFKDININSFKINVIKQNLIKSNISESMDYLQMVEEYLKINNIFDQEIKTINKEIFYGIK